MFKALDTTREKPGALIVGEFVNNPDRWLKSIDATMNFTLRQVKLEPAAGRATSEIESTRAIP